MNLKFGTIKSVDGGRCAVELPGFNGEAAGLASALLLQPCGQGNTQTWMPPCAGDTVAVLFDEERPEDSLVVGGVYGDSQKPVIGKNNEAAFKAQKVTIGNDTGDVSQAVRDDLLQSQLSDIKAALDALKTAFESHVHTLSAVPVTTGTPPVPVGVANGATLATTTPVSRTYTVGDTHSKSVYIN